MVYFRCTSSGSGKGNTVIVTCAEQFAGVAITIAKIGKSYTKVCPLSAPYVVKFYGVEAGTYTVSATVSGQTYSAEVVVQDVSCVLDYGFTWKTWVDTAQHLDSTDYASLSEVLADEEAVRELFTEHACVDYMASVGASNADLEAIIENDLCAKWINNRDYALDYLGANVVIKALMDEADKYGYGEWVITDDSTTPPTWGAKGNVPVMMTNNDPYGEAFGSTKYSGSYDYYMLFDENISTKWSTATNQITNQYIGYKFTSPVCIKGVAITNPSIGEDATRCIKTFKVQYSNDNTSWNDVTEVLTNDTTLAKTNRYTFNNDNYALYWRVFIVSNNGSTTEVNVSGLQFYGRSLSVSVPTMTSNTAPYGEAFADSAYVVAQAYKVFDGDDSTYCSMTSGNTRSLIGYKFNSKVAVKFIRLAEMGTPGYTRTFKIQASNDDFNNDIVDVANITFTTTSGTVPSNHYVELSNIVDKKSFRAVCEEILAGSGYGISITTLQFYGKDYSEKEFEVGTTKKWLYDHGVELVNTQYRKGSSGVDPEKYDDFIKLQSSSASNSFCYCDFVEGLVNYNLARVKIRDVTLSMYSDYYFQGVLGLNDDSAFSAVDSRLLPNNLSLNISSVNDSTKRISVGANSAGNGILTFTELWLE